MLDQEARARQERGNWDLRLLIGILGDAEAPLGAQAEVEEQANQWASHWGENDAELKDGEAGGGGDAVASATYHR